MSRSEVIRAQIARMQRNGLVIAVVAGVLCGLGAAFDTTAFFRAWLIAFIFWWEIAVGCLGLACIYQMTGGAWGFVSRPFIDSAVRTLPLLALAFVPIALGLDHIYPWTESGFFASHHHMENRQTYLEESFFIARAVGYFVIWLFFGMILTWSTVRGKNQLNTPATQRLGRFGGIGAAFVLLSVSFAAFDWLMTLTPLWYSTMFGALVAAGGLFSGMAMNIASVSLILRMPMAPDAAPKQVLNDLGNLQLAFVMVWTYFSFSQFLITWSGNLPEEVAWYEIHFAHGWNLVAIALALLHFVVPFLLLLSRDIKRYPERLGKVAIGLLAVHLLEIIWTVKPTFPFDGFNLHWLDLVAPFALGGVFLAYYGWELKRRLVPVAELLTEELEREAVAHD